MLTPGSTVGPYAVVGSLGAGGMGEVYRARDSKLGRDVALKILPELFASDPERLARFEREARTLASLNHPHIAHIYGFEQSGTTSALVMELVDGEDLSQRIARGPIPLDEALPIATQIADALEAAHEQGIIHRDLKPANIKVRPDGTVKVLDFGLAKALDQASGSSRPASDNLLNSPTITSPAAMTMGGMILGTAAYMAPEQAKGKPVDKRADIWAFGCVLYEVLTGRRAFAGEDITETLALVIMKEPDWNAIPPTTPPSIKRLLRRCLEKDRKRRLADASDARLEIEDAVSGMGNLVESPPLAAGAHSGWRRAIATAALSAVVFGIAGAFAARQFTPASSAPATRFAIVARPDQQFRRAGRTMAISPDGSRLVLAMGQGLFIRPLDSFASHEIAGADPGALDPTFSPDGQSIGYWSARDQSIKSIAVSGGVPITHGAALRDGVGVYAGMSWGRDGIIVGRGSAGVARFPAGGGPPETIVDVAAGEHAASPTMLPDNDHVLFTIMLGPRATRSSNGQVVAQSIRTKARTPIVDGASDAHYLPTGHLVFAVEGVLFAAPFDLDRLVLTRAAVPVVDGVLRAGVSNATSQFSVAQNGTLVYVPGPSSGSNTSLDLAYIDQQGSVTALRVPPGPYEAPRLSPDGTHVAFHSDDGKEAVIWIHDVGSKSTPRRLTFGGRNRFPTWSPDGQYVVFQSDREGDFGLFRQRADGSRPAERLTRAEGGAVHVSESWSAASGHLLFSSTRNGETTLLSLYAPDQRVEPFGGVRSLTPTGAVFSPDGRWVAYATTEKGRPVSVVYVQPFPATGATYQISRDDDGHHPVWSPDGRQLGYVPGPGRMAIVSVTTTPSFTSSAPATRPPAGLQGPPTMVRNFDVVDATRVIGLVPAGEGQSAAVAPEVHVVLNWFEELKTRVPVKGK